MSEIKVHTTAVCRKTRIAPTPSGFLHLGNLFSFALTSRLAARTGARILLRIDDMDSNRVRPEYVQDIFDVLRYMNLPWQEGPRDAQDFNDGFAQRLRLPLYEAALGQLGSDGHVFACTCSRSGMIREGGDLVYPGTCRNRNIPLDTPGASWRLHTPPGVEVEVKTLSGTVVKAPLPASVQDAVIRKKDGMPAYQLSSLVDDLHYGIDLVVRGQDLWPSTLVQHYLAHLLGKEEFSNARFHHHPLLSASGGRKLSKSAGDTSIHQLIREGRSASGIYDLIAQSDFSEGSGAV